MLCQNCEKKEATTHIKQIINGEMSETYLCSECAKLLGANDMFSDFNLNFSEFFGNFFGDMLPAHTKTSALKCPRCGCTFDDIVKSGKVGCTECYTTFYEKLLPSLQRIHGKLQHTGKISASADFSDEENAPDEPAQEAEPSTGNTEKIAALKKAMDEAVSKQDFEEAAKIRDEIKELEGGENK